MSFHQSTHRILEYFDYGKTKEEFKTVQCNYIKKKSKGIVEGKVHLWTREKVDIYIDIILEYKKKNESYLADEEMCKYDIDKINSVYKLVLRKKRYRGQRIEVVPFEDCFDKILLVHRRLGHNNSLNKILYKVLTKKYVIDKIWVFLLQRSCNFCKSNKEFEILYERHSEEHIGKFNRCYQIVINYPIGVTGCEFQQKMLMIVVDRKTNFVFLRPLLKLEEYNVALELVKIFTDYGFPRLIETRETSLFEKVIQMLPRFNKEYKFHLVNLAYGKNPGWCNRVMVYLKEWMDVNESNDWVSGCPIVQWQMNTLRRRDNSTPYKEVFNMEPVKDLLVG